ncbi:hypothetical protein ACL02U_04955 [Streptomyces sp. MS06]|uniref:hypothetical protein n=1 Tax=Streptomyces sp. MS06 TaxID=3385974 RepID=UPI0039A00F42
MGSLRNPIGPLPSSIYWRRRFVLLSALALSALLMAWVVTSGGGSGDNRADASNGGRNPAPSITPGPSGSGPAISQHPGGRDTSGGTGSGGSDSGASAGGSGGDGDASGGTGDGADDGANGSGDGAAAGGAAQPAGSVLPAGSTLPDCTAGSVTLTVSSLRNSYSPDQTPTFRLLAKNTSGTDCKVDLGPATAVLTITQTDSGDAYWASDDCPHGARSRLYRVPAGSSIAYTVKWDRKPSADACGTPPPGTAEPGTYLLEARAPGYATVRTSFVLSAD